MISWMAAAARLFLPWPRRAGNFFDGRGERVVPLMAAASAMTVRRATRRGKAEQARKWEEEVEEDRDVGAPLAETTKPVPTVTEGQ